MNLGLRDAYKKANTPIEWPTILNDKEQEAILNEAEKAGQNAHISIAAILYLGLTPDEASKLTLRKAMGEAIRKNKDAFITVPFQFTEIILFYWQGKEIGLNDKAINSTPLEILNTVENIFEKAGINKEKSWVRLRRTSATIQYTKMLTGGENIERYYTEIGKMDGALKDVYYNPEMEEEYKAGAIDDKGRFVIIDMPELLPRGGRLDAAPGHAGG